MPHYDEMLDAAAGALPPRTRRIVDLGIGTGALASRALARAPRAALTGIDTDAGMLALAGRRLGARATLVRGTFLRTPFPAGDAIIASLALHHVRTRRAKARLYRRARAALRSGGVFISADCHPARDRTMAAAQMDAWRAHVRRSYSPAQTRAFLRAWAREDVYVSLDEEIALLRHAGFRVEVAWRRGAFAVLVGAATRWKR